MDNESIIFDKEGFKFIKIKSHYYKLTFSMENPNIILSNIIDFNLIKLIYDLNGDVYEKVNLEKLNNNEAHITLVMKHFFEDLGLPQRFSYLYMTKIIEHNKIIFNAKSITTSRPKEAPIDAELLTIKNLTSICDIITPHKINFSFNIYFNETLNIPPFVEKIVGMIIHKIFKRLKQFIENVRIN